MSPSPSQNPRFALLCFGFVVCGIVTVLPGPLLPMMAAHWGLRDVQSGAFFTAQFAASTVAAILAPHWLRRSLPGGYLLMAAGSLLLAAAMHGSDGGHVRPLAAFALIGSGFGFSVTATNLTVGAEAGGRARRLSVVNLWWGIGAVVCPWIVAAVVRSGHLAALLWVLALAAILLFAALAPQMRLPEVRRSEREPVAGSQKATLVFFAGFLFLYVGVENTLGGWIASYAHRFSGMNVATASLLVSLYWLALLAGRGAGSLLLRVLAERMVLLPSLALAVAAVGFLMVPHAPWAVVVAVALAGAGFGPVFPLGVSRMLGRLNHARNTGWVFAMCAGGGAVLPWLTGVVSTASQSLRIGFAVPEAALALILLLALGENAVLREPTPAEPLRQQV